MSRFRHQWQLLAGMIGVLVTLSLLAIVLINQQQRSHLRHGENRHLALDVDVISLATRQLLESQRYGAAIRFLADLESRHALIRGVEIRAGNGVILQGLDHPLPDARRESFQVAFNGDNHLDVVLFLDRAHNIRILDSLRTSLVITFAVFLLVLGTALWLVVTRLGLAPIGRDLERANFAITHSADAIFWVGPDARILGANGAACHGLGYSETELKALSLPDFDPHCQAPRWPDHWAEVRSRGGLKLETEHIAKDGRRFPVEIVANVLRIGREEIMCAIARDISERKRIEQELRRSNQDLQQFAYVASHDLREPLRMVTSYLRLLERRSGACLDEDGRTNIGFAIDGAQRMDALITDLLQFCRVDSHGADIEAVDATAALGRVLETLAPAIAEAGATVTFAPLPRVMADPHQLAQVFQNLITNGLKYQAPNAHPAIHVSAEVDGGDATFAVRDNGIGIAPEFHHRIFVIFQRLHHGDDYAGTGIGLAVCTRIIERHGGRIWVESEPGQGSTFRFTLPLA